MFKNLNYIEYYEEVKKYSKKFNLCIPNEEHIKKNVIIREQQ